MTTMVLLRTAIPLHRWGNHHHHCYATSMWRLLLLLTIVTSVGRSAVQATTLQGSTNNDRECTLACNTDIGSYCKFTTSEDLQRFASHPLSEDGQPLEWHVIVDQDGMHCACPNGWTGVDCNIPYVLCPDSANHICYHGGKCVPPGVETDGQFCFCERAYDADGKHYVGKYCEQTADDYCDPSGKVFCINKGKCNRNYPESGDPCICDDDHFGDHCQYNVNAMPDVRCALNCQNGGTCVLGQAPAGKVANNTYLAYHPVDRIDQHEQHCDCPDGFDGDLCQVQRTSCGSNFCFHGGRCVERTVDGQPLFHCDCSAASTEEADYAGRFCQFKATSYCNKVPGMNGRLFCTNGGTCQEDIQKGCICPDPFVGFSCEFVRSDFEQAAGNNEGGGLNTPTNNPPVDPASAQKCDLSCKNDGVCRFGPKQGVDAPSSNSGELLHDNYMHCVCPQGFAGLYCEQDVEICGNGEHLCLNGGKCVKYGDEDACDCSSAMGGDSQAEENTSFFVGNKCQHPVNDLCSTDFPRPGQPLLFCVNGGQCLAYVASGQPHPGCKCKDGFSGPHCELSPNAPETPNTNLGIYAPDARATANSGRSGFQKFLLSFFVLSVILSISYLATFLWKRRPRRRNIIAENIRWATEYQDRSPDINLAPRRRDSSFGYQDYPANVHASSTDPFATHLAPKSPQVSEREPEVYIGPPRDEDGHVLHDVDVI